MALKTVNELASPRERIEFSRKPLSLKGIQVPPCGREVKSKVRVKIRMKVMWLEGKIRDEVKGNIKSRTGTVRVRILTGVKVMVGL